MSSYSTLSLVLCTHGMINSVLLWAFDSCRVWNLTNCTDELQEGMDWLVLHHASLYVLFACLTYRTPEKNSVLQQRLGIVMALILVTHLTTSIFLMSYANTMFLSLQNVIHIVLLAILFVSSATLPLHPQPTPLHLMRSSSFDVRARVRVVTVALGFCFIMSLAQCGSPSTSSSPLLQVVEKTSQIYEYLTVLVLLGSSLIWASPAQQQALLMAHVVCLLSQQWLLDDLWQLLSNFLAILIGILGATQALPK